MSDLRDFTGKNPQFTGTEDMLVPKGGTSERPGGTDQGRVRYNTDLGFLEQYNASGWAGIDAPPTVSSITGTIYDTTDQTITIIGSNFKSGSSVSVTGDGVNNIDRTLSTTFVNSGELSAATNAASVNYITGASFNIKVTNPSGLSAVLEPAGNVNSFPVWSTGAGSLGTLYDSNRSSAALPSLSASDADGGAVTFSVVSGSLPSGLTLNSNGTFSGTANSVGSDTTSNFTVRATDNESDTVDRAFSITVKAPVTQTFTSNGTFSVPTGVTSVQTLVVAGGGSGGHQVGGGGGGGGFVEAPNYPVTPGGTVSYTVGNGGPGPNFNPSNNVSYPGGNSTFGAITALGGGGGGCHQGPGGGIPTGNGPGGPGGSGGGAGAGPGGNSAGGGNQGPSGGYTGYGNNGGSGTFGWSGGGGGGAGGGGTPSPGGNNGGPGGIGRQSSITGSSVYYSGGGGGTGQNGTNGSGGAGGGAPGSLNNQSARNATFYGGGGGGARDHPTGGGDGHPGVVIVRY